MLPFRVLARTDLACSSRHPTCNPPLFILLRTLLLSWRSFAHSHRLFSIACGLFYKNTRGGIPLSRPQGAQIIPLREHTLPHLSPSLAAPASPLESTLVKVYQNKQLYLPLESTLMQKGGEGPPLTTHESMRQHLLCSPLAGGGRRRSKPRAGAACLPAEGGLRRYKGSARFATLDGILPSL